MQALVEAAFTRGDGFLRAVFFLKKGAQHFDAPLSAVFSAGSKEHIFIPAPGEDRTDPVYPEEGAGQFVRRIEKGIYHATLFCAGKELDVVKKVRVFAGGAEFAFEP